MDQLSGPPSRSSSQDHNNRPDADVPNSSPHERLLHHRGTRLESRADQARQSVAVGPNPGPGVRPYRPKQSPTLHMQKRRGRGKSKPPLAPGSSKHQQSAPAQKPEKSEKGKKRATLYVCQLERGEVTHLSLHPLLRGHLEAQKSKGSLPRATLEDAAKAHAPKGKEKWAAKWHGTLPREKKYGPKKKN
ncbi:hypothetical protein NDU88_006653 [Pleurodeles waltl]|uniref:Uncharacterized protein n=1 Tax=Pleurodeles waltl TaxID=8319 RepID=A0AAV7WFE7_PLEWA|nr:hypothetical protein NDU88_006653 [Pleurodeles waltl]